MGGHGRRFRRRRGRGPVRDSQQEGDQHPLSETDGKRDLRTPPPASGWPTRASPIPGSARSGSTTTMTGGWTSSWANGAVVMDDRQPADSPYPYAQENQIFRGDGTGPVSGDRIRRRGGPRRWIWWRSAGEPPSATSTTTGTWTSPLPTTTVRAGFFSTRSVPATIGWVSGWRVRGAGRPRSTRARVALFREGRKPLWRRCHTDGSYLSANDSRVIFWTRFIEGCGTSGSPLARWGCARVGAASKPIDTSLSRRERGEFVGRGTPLWVLSFVVTRANKEGQPQGVCPYAILP